MISKIALVTGGSRGLGKDIAISLSRKNIDVILTYKTNKEDAEKVVNEIKENGQNAVCMQFDVGDLKSFDPFLVRMMLNGLMVSASKLLAGLIYNKSTY